jgi:hypothetical protein
MSAKLARRRGVGHRGLRACPPAQRDRPCQRDGKASRGRRGDRPRPQTLAPGRSEGHEAARGLVPQFHRGRPALRRLDSRYGENYWLDVGGDEPVQLWDTVRYRDDASVRPDLVNVLDEVATKKNVFPRPNTSSRVGKDLRTFLSVRAWVSNLAFNKAVWIDLHVFQDNGERIAAGTFPLAWEGSASGAGDVFVFDAEIYKGLTATPGSVSPRPDARFVQFRIYYAVLDQVFSDDIVHQLELPRDEVTP